MNECRNCFEIPTSGKHLFFHNPGNDGKLRGKQKKRVIDTRD